MARVVAARRRMAAIGGGFNRSFDASDDPRAQNGAFKRVRMERNSARRSSLALKGLGHGVWLVQERKAARPAYFGTR